jgi:cephalosporin hydroxylase
MAMAFLQATAKPQYSYNFHWQDRPIIQYPQDIMAMQELIWEVKPDLIIETGIAHGGSLTFSTSMLTLLDMCDAIENGKTIDPSKSSRKVLGIDIDIGEHNRTAILDPASTRTSLRRHGRLPKDTSACSSVWMRTIPTIMSVASWNYTCRSLRSEVTAWSLIP